MRLAMCCAVAGVLSAVPSLGDWGPTIAVSPPQPTTADPVSISVWEWFGDPGQQLVSATYSQAGGQIDMEVVWYDLHWPGTIWPAVMVHEHASVNIATLSRGHYQVDSTMYMLPWWSTYYDPYLDEWFYSPGSRLFLDEVSTSFDVVPEPASLMLLAFGVLAVSRRLRRPR